MKRRDMVDREPKSVSDLPTSTEYPNPTLLCQVQVPRSSGGHCPHRFEVVGAVSLSYYDDFLMKIEGILSSNCSARFVGLQ